MARRGRKSDPNAKRKQTTREGRRSGPQSNNPVKEHRTRMHGMAHVSTDHILDILAAKGWLTDPQDGHDDRATRNVILRDAGKTFSQLYQRMHGRATAGAIDLNSLGVGKDSPNPGDAALGMEGSERARYLRMQDILLDCGRQTFDAVVNVAVFGRAPADWRRPQGIERLRVGLAALADVRPRQAQMRAARQEVVMA